RGLGPRTAFEQLGRLDVRAVPLGRTAPPQLVLEEIAKQIVVAVLGRRRAAEERHRAPQLLEKLHARTERLGDLEIERRKDARAEQKHLLPAPEAGEDLLREI